MSKSYAQQISSAQALTTTQNLGCVCKNYRTLISSDGADYDNSL